MKYNKKETQLPEKHSTRHETVADVTGSELIKITEQDGKKAVNARELHAFLESRQDFSTWIQYRIRQYDFVENEDYAVFHNFVENPKGGRPSIEYALSLNMAKELSMVEGNAKGKQARRYFIACEEAVTEAAAMLAGIYDRLRSIERLLTRQIVPPQQQRFDSEGVLSYINQTGRTMSKSQLTKLTAAKKIPCSKFFNRLVFEKQEIDRWIESQTVKVENDSSEAALLLSKSAARKLKHPPKQPPAKKQEELMTLKEAAAFSGYAKTYLYAIAHFNYIPSTKIKGVIHIKHRI